MTKRGMGYSTNDHVEAALLEFLPGLGRCQGLVVVGHV
jgi:hypothetical protein